MGFLKKAPAHPFLLAAFLVLDVAQSDLADISISDLLLSWLVLSGICLLIYFVLFLISKRSVAAATATTFLVFLLSYYMPLLNGFRGMAVKISMGGIARHLFMMPLVVALGAGVIIFFLCSRKEHSRLNAYLNILLAVLTAFYLVRISWAEVIEKPRVRKGHETVAPSSNSPARSKQINRIHLGYFPDIYFVVFDSYTSSESLNKYWNYDNSDVERYLENKRFHIVPHSRISTPETLFSIAADLNTKEYARDTPRRTLLADMRNSRVISFIEDKGYELVNYSIFDLSGRKKYYEFSLLKENQRVLEKIFNQSLMGMIKINYFEAKRGVDKQFEIMAHLIRGDFGHEKGPLFIYAHFLITHPPALIDKDGNILAVRRASQKEGYLDQIYFANKKIKEFVDAVLAMSDKPPIIVIQGDHGSRLLKGYDGDADSHAVFNAFYLPRNDYEAYSADISPSYTMGTILSQYYGYE